MVNADHSGTPFNQSKILLAFDSTPEDPPAATVVTLNSTRTSDSPFSPVVSPPRLLADSATNIIAAMEAHSVRKLIFISALGARDSFHALYFPL